MVSAGDGVLVHISTSGADCEGASVDFWVSELSSPTSGNGIRGTGRIHDIVRTTGVRLVDPAVLPVRMVAALAVALDTPDMLRVFVARVAAEVIRE